MAWYAELKRRKWYCINQFNAIRWYGKYLYEQWYNGLTDEEKQRIEEYKREKELKNKKELDAAIKRLAIMSATVAGLYNRNL